MNFTKTIFAAGITFGLAGAAFAAPQDALQDTIEQDSIETTPDRERVKPAELDSTIQARPIALVFTSMDTNFDKRISLAELSSGMEREWQTMSPSFSGKVSAIKFARWAEATLGSEDAMPSRLSFDKDFDSQVSKSEFTKRLRTTFDYMDEDDDGYLSRAELTFKAVRRTPRHETRRPERQRRDTQLPRRRTNY